MSESNHTAVVVPTIGESITSVFIAQWFKKVGEYVNEGESLPRAPELPEQEPREREVSGRVMNGSVARPGWQRATEGSRAFRKPLGQAGTHA